MQRASERRVEQIKPRRCGTRNYLYTERDQPQHLGDEPNILTDRNIKFTGYDANGRSGTKTFWAAFYPGVEPVGEAMKWLKCVYRQNLGRLLIGCEGDKYAFWALFYVWNAWVPLICLGNTWPLMQYNRFGITTILFPD